MTVNSRTVTVLALLMTLGLSTAIAEETRAGRYTMHKSDDGFVRLDTETGAVSMCRRSEGEAWACKPMAGADRSSSFGELARLRRENAELKAEIRRMEEDLGLHGNRRKSAREGFKLPTEEEVDQALNYFERMLKKFQDRLNRLERKSEAPERQL